MYLTAYNIIANDSINKGKTLMALDSIVELGMVFFHKELKQKDEDDIAVMTRLYKTDQNEYQYINSCFKLTFLGDRNRKYSNNMVLFSPIINDSILRADLHKSERCLDKHKHLDTREFSKGCIYLFVFDKNGELKLCYRKEMIWG